MISLLTTVPASRVYAREGAPVFRAFDDMAATAHGTNRVDTIAMHAGARRAAEWAAPILPARVTRAPHGREWLALVALWKTQPAARVWFAADPRRTDLALFDAHARQLARGYRWGFIEPPFVGGARNLGNDLRRVSDALKDLRQPLGALFSLGIALVGDLQPVV